MACSGRRTPAGEIPLHGSLLPHLLQLSRPAGASRAMCGDVNIAHKEIDIKNWKGAT
ncbi:hypothetical protein ACU4GD_15995 [Cupriavidus basilensis]